MSDLQTTVRDRADDQCELCAASDDLALYTVEPLRDGADGAVLLCGTCRSQHDDDAELDGNHWYCLQGAIWSETPAVQVLSLRMLRRLKSEPWAAELLEQAYLSDEVKAWAEEGQAEVDHRPPAFDSNGAALADGDSVTLIKDLDVKGANFTAKRGTLVKGIRLTDNPEEVDCRVNKIAIVLRTEFLKKA